MNCALMNSCYVKQKISFVIILEVLVNLFSFIVNECLEEGVQLKDKSNQKGRLSTCVGVWLVR